MKRNLITLCLMAIAFLPMKAQFVFVDINSLPDPDKSRPIDELLFRVQYEMTMLPDTTRADATPNAETMMLEVGKHSSGFYSYTTYVRDSVLLADRKNKASNEVMNEHLKAYGNARISYQIFKNYPKGKVTTLDRVGREKFRCEEVNEQPQWTLLADTATLLGYPCQKAACQFRGRTYTAWYTPDIPSSEGPWKLCGLPGLILKAEDSRGHYTFTCTGVETEKTGKPLLYNDEGYESISRKDLNKVYERYDKDPLGFLASTAPNMKVTVTDGQGNAVKKIEGPHNPIELSEK